MGHGGRRWSETRAGVDKTEPKHRDGAGPSLESSPAHGFGRPEQPVSDIVVHFGLPSGRRCGFGVLRGSVVSGDGGAPGDCSDGGGQ